MLQQVFREPGLMPWAGGQTDRWEDTASATFPADTTVLSDSAHPKAPGLTYLFNLDYTTQLPSGNEE